MGSGHNFRKAIGAIKDSTKVGLANLNSDNKALDIAIVKATNHDEFLPKEKHVRRIFIALSGASPRCDVIYCLHGLAKRLAKTRTWTVALKVLLIVHRALREVGPAFRQELLSYSHGRGLMLNLSHFKDESSQKAYDYSAWIRTYALYLEERLDFFRILKYDVQFDKPKTRTLDTQNLLQQLPVLQGLLSRLLACKPLGAAAVNALIHYPLSIVAGESVRLYVAIADGILNLYFEMPRDDAIRALDLYRKSAKQAEELSEFFQICRALAYGRHQNFVNIQQPPASFIATMENYVKEAPQTLLLENSELNDNQDEASNKTEMPKITVTSKKAQFLIDYEQDENSEEESDTPPDPKTNQSTAALIPDLLCMDDVTETEGETHDANPLALAIVQPENSSNSVNGLESLDMAEPNDWELALVTVPSSNATPVEKSNLVGSLDKLTLDSLYDAAMSRTPDQNENGNISGPMSMSSNPFDYGYNQDPFHDCSHEAAQGLQIPDFAQQQAFFMQWQLQLQQQQPPPMVSPLSGNPFGNPFEEQSNATQSPICVPPQSPMPMPPQSPISMPPQTPNPPQCPDPLQSPNTPQNPVNIPPQGPNTLQNPANIPPQSHNPLQSADAPLL
ncbi:hypothetical protein ACFE04_010067 [Oxalis oulophora]